MSFKNHSHHQIFRFVIVLILASIVLGGLTGCLVKKKDLKKIARTTDKLRIYKPGDYILYDVSITRVPNLSPPVYQSGTLRIEWKLHPDIAVPFTGGAKTIPVIQEVSTLDINGGTSNLGTTKYISQDANGQVTLHAIEAIGTENHYWLNTSGDSSLTTINYFTTFNSPLSPGDQSFDSYDSDAVLITSNPTINYYVLEGCEGNASCSSAIGVFSNDHDIVGDSHEITSKLGVFINPFQINFSGSATPSPAPFPVTFDIVSLCGTDHTTFDGTMYVMPEIGMVEMTNTCRDVGGSGDYVYYTYTIRSYNLS